MDILPPKKIKIIETTEKGRCVVATEKIFKDEIIEYCPLVVIGKKDSEFIKDKKNSEVLYYYYLQQPELQRDVIILGYGSLYNHSSTPNAEIDFDDNSEDKYIIYRALNDIEIGEEITWDYDFDNDIVEFLEQK